MLQLRQAPRLHAFVELFAPGICLLLKSFFSPYPSPDQGFTPLLIADFGFTSTKKVSHHFSTVLTSCTYVYPLFQKKLLPVYFFSFIVILCYKFGGVCLIPFFERGHELKKVGNHCLGRKPLMWFTNVSVNPHIFKTSFTTVYAQ